MSSRKNTKTSAPKGEKAVKNVEDANVSSVVEQSVLNQNGSDNIEENSEADQAKESVNDAVSVPEQEQTDVVNDSVSVPEQEQTDTVNDAEQEQTDAVNDAVYVPEQEQTDETKSNEIPVQNKQERPLVLNSGKVIVNKPLFPQNKYNKKIIVKKFC